MTTSKPSFGKLFAECWPHCYFDTVLSINTIYKSFDYKFNFMLEDLLHVKYSSFQSFYHCWQVDQPIVLLCYWVSAEYDASCFYEACMNDREYENILDGFDWEHGYIDSNDGESDDENEDKRQYHIPNDTWYTQIQPIIATQLSLDISNIILSYLSRRDILLDKLIIVTGHDRYGEFYYKHHLIQPVRPSDVEAFMNWIRYESFNFYSYWQRIREEVNSQLNKRQKIRSMKHSLHVESQSLDKISSQRTQYQNIDIYSSLFNVPTKWDYIQDIEIIGHWSEFVQDDIYCHLVHVHWCKGDSVRKFYEQVFNIVYTTTRLLDDLAYMIMDYIADDVLYERLHMFYMPKHDCYLKVLRYTFFIRRRDAKSVYDYIDSTYTLWNIIHDIILHQSNNTKV